MNRFKVAKTSDIPPGQLHKVSVEQKEIVQDAIRLGARDYVVKPFDRSSVPLVLNKVLRQR